MSVGQLLGWVLAGCAATLTAMLTVVLMVGKTAPRRDRKWTQLDDDEYAWACYRHQMGAS